MNNPLLQLAAHVDKLVREHIFRQPDAKAFALAAYADAEDSGEGQIFDRALHHVTDPRLRRMVERHRDDETRHARILRERRDALGLPIIGIPSHLELVDRLSQAAGGVLDKAMDTGDHIADAWAMLYVIEERALDEFKRSGDALAAAEDAETSALFFSIRKDEERHLRYCTTVGRRYDPSGFDTRIARMREIELTTYGAQSRAWTRHQLESGYLKLPFALNIAVVGLMRLTEWLKMPALPPVVEDWVNVDEKLAA